MLMMNRVIFLCLVIGLAGCAGPRVDWDYDESVPMTGMKSYAWFTGPEGVSDTGYQLDGLMDRRVRSAIDIELAAKGFKKVSESEADFLVNYLTSVKTRRDEEHVSTSMGYGFHSWGMGLRTETRVSEYEEGALMIDIINPENNELIWRGRSKSRVVEKATPAERTEKINSAVSVILEGFPPGQSGKVDDIASVDSVR